MSPEADVSAALDVLVRAAGDGVRAARDGSSARLVPEDQGYRLLQSVVDAAVMLFEAEAASIALVERDPERLEFRVASGAHGAGVVGLSVPPSRGVVGYVFSTGQAIALSDVTADPRFDRATAERTGYVPRSIAAVPLTQDGSTVGVLQVLDKHGSATFTLRDMSMLGVFATQAGVAIRATRVARGAVRLLRTVLAAIGEADARAVDLDAVFAAAARDLDGEEGPFWRLADRLAAMYDLPERDHELAADILAAATRRERQASTYRRRAR